MNEEVLAGIKLLVAIAKADARLHDNEEIALTNALEGADLGPEVSVEALLKEVVDVDAEIAKIVSPENRRSAYEAACAMIYVDGEAAASERAILEKMRSAWEVTNPKSVAERVGTALKNDWIPSTVEAIDDPVKRDEAIDALVPRACVRAAIFGAIPVPFIGEFLVSFVEIQTLQAIGAMYGHTRDAAFYKAFIGNFVGATAARIAVLSLMKLVPGWGSVMGASGAYASTWAMARATRLYFESGTAMDPYALRKAFQGAKEEGVERAKAATGEIEAGAQRLAATKEKLDAELASGAIDEARYTEELAKTE